jgi:hypothetical protein
VEDDPNELVLNPNAEKGLSGLASALSGLDVGLNVILSRKSESPRSFKVVLRAYLLVLACGLLATWQLLLLFFGYALRRPVLVVNKDGIFRTAVGVRQWFIRWDEIALIKVYSYRDEDRLGIVPRDVDAYFANQSRFIKKGVKAGLELGRAPLNIDQSLLPIPVSELADQMEQRFGVKVERAAKASIAPADDNHAETTTALQPSDASIPFPAAPISESTTHPK